MAAQNRHEQLKTVAETADDKAHTIVKLLNVGRKHVAGVVLDAVIIFFMSAVGAHVPKKRLVAVEHADSIFRHTPENFELGLQDALTGAKMFDMHGADVGDNSDIGLCDRSQAGHFSEVVHAQLQNSRFSIVRHIEDGHGQTDVVVVVALGASGAVGTLQHTGGHFLGRRFADAAGNADDGHTHPFAAGCGKIAVGLDGIGYKNGRDGRLDRSLHKRGTCAKTGRHADKVMAVGLLTLDGDEEVAGLYSARIDLDAGDHALRLFRRERSPAVLRCLLQCQFLHAFASKYDATTSRSSRWCFSWPIS